MSNPHSFVVWDATYSWVRGHISIESATTSSLRSSLIDANTAYNDIRVSLFDDAPITIGSHTLIGPGVTICTGTHDTCPKIRREVGGSHALPIEIGEESWIGAKAVILPGVNVGNRAIVAAGAVINKDVPDGVTVGGVPAKILVRGSEASHSHERVGALMKAKLGG